jgi:hypothetical protein
MGNKAQSESYKNSATAQGWANNLMSNANQIYGSLAPTLENEAINPQGMSPTDLAATKTSNMQTAGGTQAGATGAGRLYAMRTKNAGAAGNAIAESARVAGQQLGQENLATDLANAKLKRSQQQSGISGLEGLNQTELGASENALGLSNTALHNANQPDWLQSLAGPALGAGATVAKAYMDNN